MTAERQLQPMPEPQELAESFWEWWDLDLTYDPNLREPAAHVSFDPLETIIQELQDTYGLSFEQARDINTVAYQNVIGDYQY